MAVYRSTCKKIFRSCYETDISKQSSIFRVDFGCRGPATVCMIESSQSKGFSNHLPINILRTWRDAEAFMVFEENNVEVAFPLSEILKEAFYAIDSM